MNLIRMALQAGADLAGLARAERLREKGALDPQILPSARTVVVVACARRGGGPKSGSCKGFDISVRDG